MTKEEVDNRINAINIMIEAQEKLEKTEIDMSDALYRVYKRRPTWLDEWEDVPEVAIHERAKASAIDNTVFVNERIKQGASFEEIADLIKNGYVDENGEKHSIEYVEIEDVRFTSIKGNRTDLRDDLIAFYYTDWNNYYTEYIDTSAVYGRIAEEAAYKGMSPDELPAELLFDMFFVKNFIDAKAHIKDIKRDYKSSVISFLEDLKKREHIETGEATKETKTDRSKHERTVEEDISKVRTEITVSDLAQAIKDYGIAEGEQGQEVADIITKGDDEKEIGDDDGVIGDE